MTTEIRSTDEIYAVMTRCIMASVAVIAEANEKVSSGKFPQEYLTLAQAHGRGVHDACERLRLDLKLPKQGGD